MMKGIELLDYSMTMRGSCNIIYRNTRANLPDLLSDSPDPGRETSITGRASIRLLEPDLVIRKLTHGGLLRHLTKDRFLSISRSLKELKASHHLICHGVNTPEVLGIRFLKKGLFFSIEVITRLIPDSVDLLTYLERPSDDTYALIRKTGTLIRDLHRLGVYHTDLHAKNILLDSRMTPWIIDLDNAFLFHKIPGILKTRNIRRFIHSLDKWSSKGRIVLPSQYKRAFMEGYT